MLVNRSARKNPKKMTREQFIETIESFLQAKDGPYDWDDFLTFPLSDTTMNNVRTECSNIDWTTQAGKDKVRKLLDAYIELAS
jgi:hypothetical protein